MYRLVQRTLTHRPVVVQARCLLVYPRVFYSGPQREAVLASFTKFKKEDPTFEGQGNMLFRSFFKVDPDAIGQFAMDHFEGGDLEEAFHELAPSTLYAIE